MAITARQAEDDFHAPIDSCFDQDVCPGGRAEFRAANRRALVTVAGITATSLLAWALLRTRAWRR